MIMNISNDIAAAAAASYSDGIKSKQQITYSII